jgi:hypothetical protein
MAITKAHVESGDVISASLMNYILDQLEQIQGGTPTDLEAIKSRLQALETWRPGVDSQVGKINGIEARLSVAETSLNNLSGTAANINALTARVTTLESLVQVTGKVRISGFDPPEAIPVGQVLTILGAGFKPTLVDNLVFVNDTPIYNFRFDSDATRLKIIVPLVIPHVTPVAGGTPITIRISNSDGEAQRTYKVVPALTVVGAAPKITSLVDIDAGNSPTLHSFHIARLVGEGLAPDQNPLSASYRLIYKTPTGPVIYPVQEMFSGGNQTEFVVPDIKEAPVSGNFQAIFEAMRGNYPTALALINMTRPS